MQGIAWEDRNEAFISLFSTVVEEDNLCVYSSCFKALFELGHQLMCTPWQIWLFPVLSSFMDLKKRLKKLQI